MYKCGNFETIGGAELFTEKENKIYYPTNPIKQGIVKKSKAF